MRITNMLPMALLCAIPFLVNGEAPPKDMGHRTTTGLLTIMWENGPPHDSTAARPGDVPQKGVTMPGHYCTDRPGEINDLSPENLPEGHRHPIVKGNGCPAEINHEDRVRLSGDGKRVHIRRKWTVCDPCGEKDCLTRFQILSAPLAEPGNALWRVPRFELLQNRPNPFTDGTVIGFYLPESSDIKLTVHQADGQVLKVWEGSYPKGYNEVKWDIGGLREQGALSYTLTTDGHSATKRMVHVR